MKIAGVELPHILMTSNLIQSETRKATVNKLITFIYDCVPISSYCHVPR